MSETPGPPPYSWLTSDAVSGWVGIESSSKSAAVELARCAAADWVQDQRPDLWVTSTVDGVEVRTYTPTDRVILGALLATARLLSREGNPAGLVNYGEFAGAVLRNDPDVATMLGIGAYGKPAVG